MADGFHWYELMTTDPKAAADYYKSVVGWTAAPVAPGMDYIVLSTPEGGIGGINSMPEGGPSPVWVGYIHVDNVDAKTDAVVKAGGHVHQPPTDVPGMLRFSMVADPQGAVFMIYTAQTPQDGGPATGSGPGYVAWRELMAGDGPAAFDWYSRLFGWTKTGVHDMGPAGQYTLFAADGDGDAGGIMTKPAEMPRPFWGYYFRVDGINAAVDRVKAGGGKVIQGPMQVPTGDWIINGTDPQGAQFALLSPTA